MSENQAIVIIEDLKSANNGFARPLREEGEQVYQYFDYQEAHDGIEKLDSNLSLCVFLDHQLGSRNKNETGAELYLQILEKFPNAYMISISSDPTKFEEAILANGNYPESRGGDVFDGIAEKKKTSVLAQWALYNRTKSNRKETLSLSINNPNTTYSNPNTSRGKSEPAYQQTEVIVKTRYRHDYCAIS